MISFPHIQLFHNVLAYVEHVNTDPEVPAKYRIQEPVSFLGTIKLHGSNCGVVWSAGGSLKAQSREMDLTPEADYKGFAKFVEARTTDIIDIIECAKVRLPLDVQQIALYGEWVGPGVVSKPKGAAVAKFAGKHWALFAVWVRLNGSDEFCDKTPDILGSLPTKPDIGNVRRIGKAWGLVIDFNNPSSIEVAQEAAAQFTASIQAQCPYGAAYGVEGAGEGVVWTPVGDFQGREDLYWKHKTEAHTVVDTKTVKERPVIADDVQAAIADFVACTVTANRLDQGIDAMEQQGLGIEKKNTGAYVKWLSADVERECALELANAGLQWPQVSNQVTAKARDFFLAECGLKGT